VAALWRGPPKTGRLGIDAVDSNFNLVWPHNLQHFRGLHARMRLDFVNEIENAEGEKQATTTTYYIDYKQDAFNKKSN
jgi:hypothetical protein